LKQPAPRVLSVAAFDAPHGVPQARVGEFAAGLFGASLPDIGRLVTVFTNGGITTRRFVEPLEWYRERRSWPEKNATYVRHARALGIGAARAALARAGLAPEAIGAIVFVSTTGIATPSVDVAIATELRLPAGVHRIPVWGLGCAGGAAGLARAADWAIAHPGEHALLVAVECCSITFVHGDRSKSNLVAASLFSDGAAAAVVGPGEGPEFLASHSTWWPGTENVMGWDVCDEGLRVRFARDVPEIVRQRMPDSLRDALARAGLPRSDLRRPITHPGGAKVLQAYQEALGLDRTALEHAYAVLESHGNMSSVSVLYVLERTLCAGPWLPGEIGVVSALGPGFSAEHVVLRR
jgi:alkylresorcinol/alkylpyrone synthase